MKLEIFSVVQKKPPVDESLILWNIVGGRIIDMNFIEAQIAIPENEEERNLIPVGEVPDMVWDNGYSMHWSDRWSYTKIK